MLEYKKLLRFEIEKGIHKKGISSPNFICHFLALHLVDVGFLSNLKGAATIFHAVLYHFRALELQFTYMKRIKKQFLFCLEKTNLGNISHKDLSKHRGSY